LHFEAEPEQDGAVGRVEEEDLVEHLALVLEPEVVTPRRSESLVASCSDDLMAMSHTLDDSSQVRYSITLGILPNTLRPAAASDCTTELGLLRSRQRDAGTDKQRQAVQRHRARRMASRRESELGGRAHTTALARWRGRETTEPCSSTEAQGSISRRWSSAGAEAWAAVGGLAGVSSGVPREAERGGAMEISCDGGVSLGIGVSPKFQVRLFMFLKVQVYINRTRIDIEQSDTQKFGYPKSLGSGSDSPFYLNYIISP
jgi:hypothetical protein